MLEDKRVPPGVGKRQSQRSQRAAIAEKLCAAGSSDPWSFPATFCRAAKLGPHAKFGLSSGSARTTHIEACSPRERRKEIWLSGRSPER